MKKTQLFLVLAIAFLMFSCGPRTDKQAEEKSVIESETETQVLERRGLDTYEDKQNEDPGLRQKVTPEPRRVKTEPESKDQELQLQKKKEEPELQSRERN